jgi:hypothetical protein
MEAAMGIRMPRVKTIRIQWLYGQADFLCGAAQGKRWFLAAAMATALMISGCSSTSGPFSSWTAPFHSDNDDTIRTQTQTDPFPTAQQAGIATHAGN